MSLNAPAQIGRKPAVNEQGSDHRELL